MDIYQKQSDLLFATLELERKPIAIRFLHRELDYESSTARPLAHGMSYCTQVKAASSGRRIKAKAEMSSCSGGSLALGLSQVNSFKASGNSYQKDNICLYDTISNARSVVNDMPFMPTPVYGVELSPLSLCENEPDVVMLIAKPYTAMRLLQAYTYHYGMKKDFRLCGNQAVCSELTVNPYLTNSINISMLCSGTRYRCKWKDEEMGVGIAFSRFPTLVESILATIADTEPLPKKTIISEKAAQYSLQLETKPGREYFTRKLRTDW